MPFKKGNIGRPKGCRDKITEDIYRQYIIVWRCLNNVKDGNLQYGKKYAHDIGLGWAYDTFKSNPLEIIRILGKRVPIAQEIKLDADVKGEIIVKRISWNDVKKEEDK